MTSPSSSSAPWMCRVSGRFSLADSGSRKIATEPSIGPSCAVESSTGICSSGFDFAAEREGVEAFARQHVEDLVVGVGDFQRLRQGLRLVAFVLDFEEDAEVGGAFRRRRLADQVGGVLGVVRVQVAREGDVEGELAELDRLTLDDLLLVALVAAGGDADSEGGEGQGGKQRQEESAVQGHRRRESIRKVLRDAGRVTVASGDGDPVALPGARLEAVAEPAQRLAPAALLPDRGRREQLQTAVERAPARSRERPGRWSASPALRSAPRPCCWGCDWRDRPWPRSTIRWGSSSSTIVVSIQIERSGALTRNRAPAPTPVDSIRVRWKSVRK